MLMGIKPSFPVPLLFLFCAIILYGLLGSPTPDNPGLIEAAIGALLILSIGVSGLMKSADFFIGRNGFFKALQILFVAGLILPTLAGVYNGNDHMLMLRDILAFAFLGLPLFLSDRIRETDGAGKTLSLLLVFTGIAFSLRTLLPAFNIWIPQGELLYLSNSPLALFAAIYLIGTLWSGLQDFTKAGLIRAVLSGGGLAILIGAMLLDVQRATIGAILLTLVILALTDLVRSPRKALLPLVLVGVLAIALYPVVSQMIEAMAHKTAKVGLNMRVQEAQAVFDVLTASPVTLFTGLGWGASFASPAVGYLEVNYTHSLLTTMALKGGLILMVLTIFVVSAALYEIMMIFQRDRVRALALFWPLVIPVLLYASHKSLDFGLLLLMIGVWSVEGRTLHDGSRSCKKKEQL